MQTNKNQITLNELNSNAIRNLIAQIDEEQSKDQYDDIDTDVVLECYDEIIRILRFSL